MAQWRISLMLVMILRLDFLLSIWKPELSIMFDDVAADWVQVLYTLRTSSVQCTRSEHAPYTATYQRATYQRGLKPFSASSTSKLTLSTEIEVE